MFAAAHEWSPLRTSINFLEESPAHSAQNTLTRAPPDGNTFPLYLRLSESVPSTAARTAARKYLSLAIDGLAQHQCSLPESPHDLMAWMQNSAQLATAKYRHYLGERQAGAPRRYFNNRAHALHFLRCVAPTKLVDGSWLYGMLAHAQNPRFSDLVQTYIEELGEGVADKNHVVLYRQLLNRHGLDPIEDLPDALYTQGTLQLALGWNADEFLPELIGFNLGYEQLPLHLLITAYELNELGIDPYYFTLHVTVDNEATGHARRAVQAVLATLPRLGGEAACDMFWQRIRQGFQLSDAGVGTTEVINGFDTDREVVRIMQQKSVAGHGAHSDYCRVAGRSVNEWLSQPSQVPDFLAALKGAGWIKHGLAVQESRFWNLLQGERAEMFGVFSAYELQVIHDWIRGDASVDGQAFSEAMVPTGKRRPTFRAMTRLAATRHRETAVKDAAITTSVTGDGKAAEDVLDPDLQALEAQLAATTDAKAKAQLLMHAMSPSEHWTPAGLYATRLFVAAK